MSRMRWFRQIAAAGAFLLGTAVVGSAAPILQEDFSTQVPGKKGGEIVSHGGGFAYQGPGGDNLTAGSYVEYDLPGTAFNPAQGTVELDVTRAEVEANEALFSFADEKGDRVFTFYVQWEGGMEVEAPNDILLYPMSWKPTTYYWQTPDKDDFGNAVTRNWANIRNTIGKGKTVHIAMTWDAAGFDIFVDGKRPGGSSNKTAHLGQVLGAARKFLVGAEVSAKIPGGAWTMTRSLLTNVQLHDRVLAPTELAQAIAPKGLHVFGLEHNAATVAGFSGKLVAGNVIDVTLTGSPGAAASFDVVHYPDVSSNIQIDWRGWGVYLENKVFFDEGEVNLRDVDGYEVYASQAPFDAAAPGMEPLAKLEVGEQQYTIETPEVDKPYYVAVIALMRDGTKRPVIAPISNQPLVESAPGVYTGSYQVGWTDRYPRAVAIGRLTSGAGAAVLADPTTFTMDPSLTIAVATSPSELKADEKSQSQITVTVTDVNGNPVPEHEVKFLLFTTSQYTGIVGGGAFAEQVGATVKETSFGKTDLFGKLTATYVAGFAAKTAVIVARDMLSNDTGAAWVKTFITATAQLELEPVGVTAAMAQGYEIVVTSSDEWLTADGKSTARISAHVTLGGEAVPGHTVAFSVASGTGSIRVVADTTDKSGEARAVYTAGKKIGMVLITATDVTAGISGSVQIELRSDAPAKIGITLNPEKLPADGRSRSDLTVLVTDINDNPNDGVEVEYAIVEGGGDVLDDKSVTDRNGETETQYVAGRTPGRVSIEITVRSTVPTPEEIAKVRDMALAVTDYKFF